MTAEVAQVPAPPAPAPLYGPRLCDCGCLRRAQDGWAETSLAFSGKCGPAEDRTPLASAVTS